jgi:protein-tyrosine-phosphatase
VSLAGHCKVASAGSHPKPLHPNTVRVLRGYGIDLTGRKPQHVDALANQSFDYVITLCDRIREICPEFPKRPACPMEHSRSRRVWRQR